MRWCYAIVKSWLMRRGLASFPQPALQFTNISKPINNCVTNGRVNSPYSAVPWWKRIIPGRRRQAGLVAGGQLFMLATKTQRRGRKQYLTGDFRWMSFSPPPVAFSIGNRQLIAFFVLLCLRGLRYSRPPFRYCAGMGLSGRSLSQEMLRIHQRVPSLRSSTLLMPRSKGSPLASWREA